LQLAKLDTKGKQLSLDLQLAKTIVGKGLFYFGSNRKVVEVVEW
jgi:hypothetical protein